MADTRLNIILSVSDKGTVKIQKATKGVKALEVQGKKSSKSLVSSFAKVGVAVAAAFSAKIFINFANNAISAADKVAKTAGKIGVATDALQELQFAAERSGLSAEAMANNLEKLNLRLAEARDGTGELKKITDQYGIAVLDAAGNTRKAEDVLGDIAELISKTGDAAEKTRITYNAFGRSGVGMINALKGGREGLAALRQEAQDTGNIIDSRLLPGFEEARDAIDTMSGSIRTTFINAIGEASPQIKQLADEIRILAQDEGFKTWLVDTIKLSADFVKALASIPKAMADVAKALRGEVTPLRAMQDAAVQEARDLDLFGDDSFVNLSLLNLEGQLRAIAAKAPALIAKHGLDASNLGRSALIAPSIDDLLATGPQPGATTQGADEPAAETPNTSALGLRVELEKQRLAQIQALRVTAAADYATVHDAMVAEINAGEQVALDFRKEKAQESLDLISELARQRSNAQDEYVDGWRTAEEERAEANIRASDIMVERGLEVERTLAEARKVAADQQKQQIDQVANQMGAAVAQIVVYGKSAGGVFKSLFQSFAAQIIQYLVKTTVTYIAEQLIQLGAALAAFAVKSAQNVSLAATTAGAAAAAGGPPAIAAAAIAASAATITAGTTAYAAGQAAFTALGSAHGGLTNNPAETTFTVRKDERLLSPNQNSDLTSFLKGKGKGGGGRAEFVFLPGGVTALGKLLWNDSRSGLNRLAVS